jgi:hypothetical protein
VIDYVARKWATTFVTESSTDFSGLRTSNTATPIPPAGVLIRQALDKAKTPHAQVFLVLVWE